MICKQDIAVLPTESYFPLRIEYQDNRSQVVVDTPNEIADGRGFKVLETRVPDQLRSVGLQIL